MSSEAQRLGEQVKKLIQICPVNPATKQPAYQALEALVALAHQADGGTAVDAFDKAMKQAWQMIDPLKPPPAGTYALGEHNGIAAALKTVRENFVRAIATQLTAPQDGAPAAEVVEGDKLWLWKNGDHFLAFRHLYPCFEPGGDPMTLGEPVGYAIFKESHDRSVDKIWNLQASSADKTANLQDSAHALLAILERAGEGATVSDVLERLASQGAEGRQPLSEEAALACIPLVKNDKGTLVPMVWLKQHDAVAAIRNAERTHGIGDPAPHPRDCDVPPPGWRCTRGAGHGGPCAAIETGAVCRSCNGSGSAQRLTHGHGPDDYEVTVDCPECNGTGGAEGVSWNSMKEGRPTPGSLIVKRWRHNGAVWAGLYGGTEKESSFDEWLEIAPPGARPCA